MPDKNIRLSERQEIFVQELIKGKSQRQAMLTAYPSRKDWKENSIDSAASTLLRNKKVNKRFNDLMEQVRKRETEKTMWTREESIETLRYVIDVNRQDLDRIQDAMEEELVELQAQIDKDPGNAAMYVKAMLKNRRTRRASQVNNKGITDAVAELNKMQGFNEETINMNGVVMFTGEDELED